ncbi:unnamed protein product [Lampetra planeri]
MAVPSLGERHWIIHRDAGGGAQLPGSNRKTFTMGGKTRHVQLSAMSPPTCRKEVVLNTTGRRARACALRGASGLASRRAENI